MRQILTPLRTLSPVFVLLFAVYASAQSTTNTFSSVLNSNGSIRSGAAGSFDPSGYRMSFGPNGEPRFLSESSQPLGTSCNDGWQNLGFTIAGVDAGIYSVVADGLGNVYIGGDFSAVYNVPASSIAKWNGSTWSALGTGIPGRVEGIAVSGTDVYVAGIFQTAGGIAARNVAKWNGTAWSALGAGVGGVNTTPARAIAVSGTDVYAGGDFGILKWDGMSWVGLGATTGPEGSVQAIAVSGSDMYIGGFFIFAGGISSPGIVKFSANTWSQLGTGLGRTSGSPQVEAITVSGTDVYVGGTFDSAGGNTVNNIAKWNGSSWSSLGTGVSGGRVTAITVSGTDVYAGGFFTAAGGNAASRVAKWTGSQWEALGSGIGGSGPIVNGIAVLGSNVVVGGDYATAGGATAQNLAIWTGSSWTTYPSNRLSSIVRGVAISGSDVYVVGNFDTAGSQTVNRVAKWNGSTWSALGTGIPGGFLNAVAVSGSNVYVGGNFSNAGGVSANNIARWNGTNWSQLGSGVSGGVVGVITIVGEDVYVGGSFSTAGGNPANMIAKWNGTSWSSLNSGILSGGVAAIVPSGNLLYVGTGTTTVDSPNYFLKYDGTTWTPLGTGMTGGGVSSIAISGSDVYVAGMFSSVGGVPGTVRIAKWNNGTWSAMGSGLPAGMFFSNQLKIAMSGTDVIATGDFRTGAGGPADRIARWNGSQWLPMGAGLNGPGNSLSIAGGDIYVGGEFTGAGCYVSPYFARWSGAVWTGAADTDWHNSANWGGGTVPPPNSGVTISANNATISSADVTVSSLIVTNGRTLAVAAGRTLTVTGNLDLTNATLTGSGSVIVNGNLTLNTADITNLASLTVNGALSLNPGKITGAGPVSVTSCTVGAIGGGSGTSFIASPLTRCVSGAGTFRFPVGTGTTYSPVELANVSGNANFTVTAMAGAYSDPATGLPANRLQRWWNLTNGGITQADVTFTYQNTEVVGRENWYRVYRISGGSATQLTTTINTTTNRATVNGVTTFSGWTLAEGTPQPRLLTGRVTNPSGRGAAGILMTLTDDQNNVRYTMTNSFGYYRFPDVLTFKVYTVRVTPKKYAFSPAERIVEVDESTGTINFVSTDN